MNNLLRANVCGTQAGYTVCFPSAQKIADGTTQVNPYYDFLNKQSVWTYTFSVASDSKKFEHWQLWICPLLGALGNKADFKIERSDDNGSSWKIINGFQVKNTYIEIDESGDPDAFIIFRITILNPNYYILAAEAGIIVVEAESDDYTFDTSYNISTPSINCNFIPPSSRGVAFL